MKAFRRRTGPGAAGSAGPAACAWALVSALVMLAAGCGPRAARDATAAPTPGAGEPVGIPVDRAGQLDGSLYRDPSGWEADLPPGFESPSRFLVGSVGPPAEEAPRVRFRGTDCIIDLAFEHPPAGEATPGFIARGREIFFFGRMDAPQPASPAEKVWAATTIPADPDARDVAYWVRFATPRDEHGTGVLRIEARAAIRALPACKETLDAVVRSVRVTTPGPSVDAGSGDRAEGG